jgi:hypothetical protein
MPITLTEQLIPEVSALKAVSGEIQPTGVVLLAYSLLTPSLCSPSKFFFFGFSQVLQALEDEGEEGGSPVLAVARGASLTREARGSSLTPAVFVYLLPVYDTKGFIRCSARSSSSRR